MSNYKDIGGSSDYTGHCYLDQDSTQIFVDTEHGGCMVAVGSTESSDLQFYVYVEDIPKLIKILSLAYNELKENAVEQ